MAERAVIDNLEITHAQGPADEEALRAAFSSRLRGPEALLAFLDHLNLAAEAVSPLISLLL